MEISCVKEVEQNPLPRSQTKPFYIGTKEAPSESIANCSGQPTEENQQKVAKSADSNCILI